MISTILTVILGLVTSPEFLIITAISVIAVALVVQVADPTGGGPKHRSGGRARARKPKKEVMPPVENDTDDEDEEIDD